MDMSDPTAAGTTSRKLYSARRGDFQYMASWQLAGPLLKWTAVVTGPSQFTKLLVGQVDYVDPGSNLRALVCREVEQRIDLQAWLD